MTDHPTLSVVMSARNSADTLPETLAAIAAQDYPAWWEVVVASNGSRDDTLGVAGSFDGRIDNLRVVDVPDPSCQARGQNYGVSQSKGDVIVFLDADDVVGHDYLRHLGRAMSVHPFVGASVDVTLLNSERTQRIRRPLQVDRIDEYCRFRPAVIGAAMGAQRTAVDAVGGFDESLETQHDLDISWRLLAAGYPATLVPQAVLHYRYRDHPRELFDQQVGYGLGEVALYAKYADQGMPRPTPVNVAAEYARLAKSLVTSLRPGGASHFATRAGMAYGRLRGSIAQRTLYL